MRRIWGLALRHLYLYLGSWPRLVEIAYWPIVNILTWGFVSLYMLKTLTDVKILSAVFLTGVILGELLIRSSISLLMLFIDEIWSRNLGHLFASPLTFTNYTVGVLVLCLLRTAFSITPAILVAQGLFHFSLFGLGAPLALFMLLIFINGCWYGLLVLSLILRNGLAAEWIGWMMIFGLIPLVAPYYPVSVLPAWMQAISWSLPATYVFASMKSLIGGHGLHTAYLWKALALNVFYFAAASAVFYAAYRGARRRGGLLQVGE